MLTPPVLVLTIWLVLVILINENAFAGKATAVGGAVAVLVAFVLHERHANERPKNSRRR